MGSRIGRSLLLLLSLALVLAASVAQADAADPSHRSRAHLRAGNAHYKAGAYDDAVTEYLQAHRLMPLPEFLFNIAQSYRLGGKARRALEYYRLYLAANPSGRGAVEVRAHILTLETTLAEEPPAPVAPTTTAPPTATDTTPAPRLTITAAQPAPVLTAPAPAPAYRRWWLWTTVGFVVAAGAGVGLGVGLGAAPRVPEHGRDTAGSALVF